MNRILIPGASCPRNLPVKRVPRHRRDRLEGTTLPLSRPLRRYASTGTGTGTGNGNGKDQSSTSSKAVQDAPTTINYDEVLTATAPAYQRHLFVYSGIPDRLWPSHIDSVSPVYRELCKVADRREGDGLSIGWTDLDHELTSKVVGPQWDSTRSRFDVESSPKEEEQYGVLIYPDMIPVPKPISTSNLDFLESFLSTLRPTKLRTAKDLTKGEIESELVSKKTGDDVQIFVCTHGTRDCRCGDVGIPLHSALSKEIDIRLRPVPLSEPSTGKTPRFSLGKAAHVGGHKFAANAIVFPTGDWYGFLQPSDASTLLDCISEGEIWWDKWRGRMGLDKDAQRMFYEVGSGLARERWKPKRKVEWKDDGPSEGKGEEVGMKFVTFQGEELDVKGRLGETLMEAGKRANVPAVEATCGGKCECATCQIYIDQEAPVPPITDEEEDMLEFAISRRPSSRLSCQLKITPELAKWLSSGNKIQLPRY